MIDSRMMLNRLLWQQPDKKKERNTVTEAMTENIRVIIHSSIRIACEAGTVYLDPYLLEEEAHDADYILVTHNHYDHFSPEDIRKIARDETILVVPEGMRDEAEKADLGLQIKTVRPAESYTIDTFSFETVASYNTLKPFHPKGAGWVGYILHDGGKRIYIAGDTDAVREAKQVKCDIALVPVGGTYTMNAKQAAELVNTIQPAVASPTHYGSAVGKKEDGEIFAGFVKPPVLVELKMGK